MHPLLTGRRIALYALAWLPVGAMVVFLLVRIGGLSWSESITLAALLCGLYGGICLTPWHFCRQMPLVEGTAARVLVASVVTAAAAGGVWVWLSRWVTAMLVSAGFPGIDTRMAASENWLWALGVLLYLLSVTFHYLLAEVQAVQAARTREVHAAMMAREAELKALRDQVNPHFLFNCLNSISALTAIDRARARQMCVQLADFLRLSLSIGQRPQIPLSEELEIIRHYLAIEQVRFEQRLMVEEDIEAAALQVLVPPLLLQPLVENAVKHGIAQTLEGGTVRLEIRVPGQELRMAIENPFDPDSPARPGAGLGIANVRKRLEALYGGAARLETRVSGSRYRAEIRMIRGAE